MAAKQTERHNIGRQGEAIAVSVIDGELTNHKAPFDVVDFQLGYAYEVKTMSGHSKDMKIHISDASMQRKQDFAHRYQLQMILVAVVVYNLSVYEVYTGELKQSMRVSQMQLRAK